MHVLIVYGNDLNAPLSDVFLVTAILIIGGKM